MDNEETQQINWYKCCQKDTLILLHSFNKQRKLIKKNVNKIINKPRNKESRNNIKYSQQRIDRIIYDLVNVLRSRIITLRKLDKKGVKYLPNQN